MSKNIRNFIIISHVDHGKSTLADRFLEITQTVTREKMKPQFLDMLALEKERGITIKMRPVRMLYKYPQEQKSYILNLIDSPGHVDFSYEVSRGLAAVEGAVLLIDAAKGIQAQTLHHLLEAQKQRLAIIPVINKIDLPQADIAIVKKEIQGILTSNQKILEISAKLGTNIKELLGEIIKKIPCPENKREVPLRALIFDFEYDVYQGVIAFVKIVEGQIKEGEKVYFLRKKIECQIQEVGYFKPEMSKSKELKGGEIGYLVTGIKEPSQVMVGDTIVKPSTVNAVPLFGYKEPKPKVFVSIYPENPNDFSKLQKSLCRLQLTDPAFTFIPEKKTAFGQGFSCSFLGNLHTEIIIARLRREFDLALIISRPQVIYKVIEKQGGSYFIFSAKDFPKNLLNKELQERWVILEILTPQKFLGSVSKLLENLRGHYLQTKFLGEDRLVLIYKAPLREIMAGFHDKLKEVSQGFASLHYEIADWQRADLRKIEILIAGEQEELFSQIAPRDKVFEQGKKIVKKLKTILPKQQFLVALQARVDGKIIARETISAQRKDVTAPLYGGDFSRKRKLLEKQKKGKKELKEKGKIKIFPEVFLNMLKD